MAATAPTIRRPVGAAPGGLEIPALEAQRTGERRAGALLLAALLVAVVYAVFAHGAAPQPEEARLQVALSLIAVATVTGLVWSSGLRIGAGPAAWAGLALLGGFAAWSGLSLSWSVFPSGTWTEFNRAVAYTLVVGLALAAGSWYPRAIGRAALAYVAITVVAALYALGGKIAPGLHISGVFDLNQTIGIARLRVPLDYWNALALVLAMAVPILIRASVDETRGRGVRLAALGLAPLYFVTVGLTYSRGGVIAAVVAVAVTMLLAGSKLRTLLYTALALAACAPALAIGLTNDDLTGNFVALSARQGDGVVLGLVLVASIAVLVVVGRLAIGIEARSAPNPARSRLIGRILGGVVLVAVLVGIVAMATSDRGLTGTVSHAWDDFRSPKQEPGLVDPGRLASTNAGNRWVWWSEAAGAWSDHPIQGWGAGSFPVTHREYRTHLLGVLQPHSMPLQFLAETGLVGFVLAMGGLLALLAAALAAVRRLAPGPERGMAAALVGASVGWFAHSFYDWDWDMPGATLPALLFLGLVCARGAFRPPPEYAPAPLRGGLRAVLLAGATLTLGAVAVSAALPSLAHTRTADALASVDRNATPAKLRTAQADADFASRIDPLSSEPLLAASSLASRRGRPAQARGYLMDAIRRDPDSLEVWLAVTRFELRRGDAANVRIALGRVLDLDPRNAAAPALLASQEISVADPASSPTAAGTPLVAVVGQTPETRRLLAAQGLAP